MMDGCLLRHKRGREGSLLHSNLQDYYSLPSQRERERESQFFLCKHKQILEQNVGTHINRAMSDYTCEQDPWLHSHVLKKEKNDQVCLLSLSRVDLVTKANASLVTISLLLKANISLSQGAGILRTLLSRHACQ